MYMLMNDLSIDVKFKNLSMPVAFNMFYSYISNIDCGTPNEKIIMDHRYQVENNIVDSAACQLLCQGDSSCKGWSYDTGRLNSTAAQDCSLYKGIVTPAGSKITYENSQDCLSLDQAVSGADLTSHVRIKVTWAYQLGNTSSYDH